MASSTSALGKFTVPSNTFAMQDKPSSRNPFPAKVKSFLSCLPERKKVSQSQPLAQAAMFPSAPAAGDAFDFSHARFLNLVRKSPRLKPAAAQKLEIITAELQTVETNAIERLKQGFTEFKQQKYSKNPEVFNKLSQGQSPTYMLVACGDSRVCPSNILGFEPGEAFVIRNVANLVPHWNAVDLAGTSAAVDFAVQALKVKHLIVVGHSRCGGIKALMSLADENAPPSGYIEKWISIAKPARARTKATVGSLPFEQQCSHCEKESVNVSLSNLLTFPFVKELVSQQKLFLHGGYYNFVDGNFDIWSLSSKATSQTVEQEIVSRDQWS